jgi:type I restriction enzyme S subunit
MTKCTVGDVAAQGRNSLVGGPFGSDLVSRDYVLSGVPVVRGANMGHGRWVDGEFVYVTPEKANSLASNCAKPGDLVFTQRGTLGQVALVPKNGADRYLISQSQMKVTLDPSKADALFLYYVFIGPEQQAYIHKNAITTGVPHTNLGILRNTPLKLPPLADQEAIAALLGSLDDKIELNQRMNATLEAMARALFQSWFVDFDPVRAKLDGRPPALNQATAALFPAAFQDSKAGNIPKGWILGKVGDIATLNRGAVNPGDFATETFDHFSLPAFDNGRSPKVELGSAIMSNKFTVTPKSVLLSKLNPHIPRIWLPDLHKSRRSVCSTEFMVVISKPSVSREYLFSLFTSAAFTSIYGTLVTGTTGSHQRIRPESVLDMKTIIPSAELIRAFTDITKPMFGCVNRNTEQSRTLATLRDTLLPKLLRGELNVSKVLQAGAV